MERSFSDLFSDRPATKRESSAVFAVVDKPSKQAHFTLIKPSQIGVKEMAESFYLEIFKHRWFLRKIISDRGPRFSNSTWMELKKWIPVRLGLSTSFHPQTVGQSERTFRAIQEMLRCFVNEVQFCAVYPGCPRLFITTAKPFDSGFGLCLVLWFINLRQVFKFQQLLEMEYTKWN